MNKCCKSRNKNKIQIKVIKNVRKKRVSVWQYCVDTSAKPYES